MLTAALIGLGNIGMGYEFDEKRVKPASHLGALKALKDKIELTCVVDLDGEKRVKAERFYAGTPSCSCLATPSSFIQSSIDTDIIVIATPEETHAPILSAILAYKHPKLVFCEKPLTTSLALANQMVSFCKNKKVSLCVNNTRRWEQSWQEAISIAKSGKYGAVKHFHGEYSGDPWRVGSHMADLVNWFGAPSYDVERIDVPYLVFNAVIWMEEGAVSIGSNGATVSTVMVGDSPRYSGVSELVGTCRGRDYSEGETPLLKAYKNILNHLEKGEPLHCTGQDGLAAVRIVESWSK